MANGRPRLSPVVLVASHRGKQQRALLPLLLGRAAAPRTVRRMLKSEPAQAPPPAPMPPAVAAPMFCA